MTLDGSGHLSRLVQLDVAHFVDCATGFLAEHHGVFFWLSQIFKNRFSVGTICNFFHNFLDVVPVFLHLPVSHLVQFLRF